MSKIALFHCETEKDIPSRVEQIIELLGIDRISALLKNKKVLIKPNLCIDLPIEKGATTHPALIDSMIKIAKDYGAKVIVGDGPIVGVKDRVFSTSGAADVCRKHNVTLINLNAEKGRVVKIENALALKEALIAEAYFDADTIVNLPTFKSNALVWLSGALKNMKGFLVGKEKHKPHKLDLSKCIADINGMLRQNLIIMDGYIGMMGDGPAAGEPANARLLIGGFDPVAVDSVAATLMGFPIDKIPVIKYAEDIGVGSSSYEIIGDTIGSFNLKFKRPLVARAAFKAGVRKWLEKKFLSAIFNRSRVVIDNKKCNVCGRCQTACPYGAITIKSNAVAIDKNKCVFCLCCHEACSNTAISIKGLVTKADEYVKGANA